MGNDHSGIRWKVDYMIVGGRILKLLLFYFLKWKMLTNTRGPVREFFTIQYRVGMRVIKIQNQFLAKC